MTGSRNSIKEKIMLIEKKPKIKLYILLVIALILALAVGCTPTETKEPAALSPVEIVPDLFAAGDAKMSLKLADSETNGTYYTIDQWYAERFEVLLSNLEWTIEKTPPEKNCEYWITALSADESKEMTFWSKGDEEIVEYREGDKTIYWSAPSLNEEFPSGSAAFRGDYDNLEVDAQHISFQLDGKAADAAKAFVHDAYTSHLTSLTPGNMYAGSHYEVVKWGVRETNSEDDAVVGWFEYAFVPKDNNSIGIWAGNTQNGTGKYEGKLTAYREFVLQKQEDGYWHCIGLGTGGYTL